MKTVPVGHIADLQNGYPFDSRDFTTAGVTPLLRIRDLFADEFSVYLPYGVPNHQAVENGDLLVGMDGDFHIKRWSRGRAALNQRVCRLRARGENDIRFVEYALPKPLGKIHATQYATTVKHLSSREILQAKIPNAAPTEQRRIADFLDDRVSRIDRIIAARRTQGLLVGQETRSALSALVLDGRDTVPVRRLIRDERLGLWGDESGASEMDVRVARVADFDRRRFGLHSVPTERSAPRAHVGPRLLRVGDTLLERSGGTHINPVGCPAYVEALDGPTVSSNFVSRLRAREGVEGRYLSLVLGALYWTRQQEPHSTQTTGIQNLNTGSYFKTEVPDRAYSEQQDLAVEGDALIASGVTRQADLTRSIELLTEYKQSLITAAVTGQLDVTTASTRIPE